MTHTVGFISQEFNECEKSDQFDLSGTLTTNNINIAIAHTQFVCTSRVSEANFGTYARRFQEKKKTRRSRKKIRSMHRNTPKTEMQRRKTKLH